MPRLISIDLGAHAVKVSTYRIQARTRAQLEDRLRMAVPQDGDPPSLEARLAALDALLEDHPGLAAAASDTVALAIPGELATFHRLTLPFTDKAQIEKTLPFTVEAEVPFDLEDMVLGWRVLRSASKQSDVLAVMVRHDEVARWIGATAERRLDPAVVHVDAELLGHYGAVGAPAAPDVDGDAESEGEADARKQAVAVVDVGHLRTLVSVVVDGTVWWSRAINVGGLSFTRAIQTALGCTYAEAEARKHGAFAELAEGDLAESDEPTDPGEGPVPAAEAEASGYAALPPSARAAVDGAIGLLLAELRSSLIKAEDSLEVSVEEVRLTGGGAKMAELWDYIGADLGVPVRGCADPDGEAAAVGYQLSHALAMQAVGQTRSPSVDLRIGDLEYRGGTDLLRAALVYGSSGVAFFTLAALVMFAVQFRSLVVEQNAAEERIRAIVTETFPDVPPGTVTDGESAVALARGMRDDAVQRAEILSRGGGGVPPTIDTLATLTSAFPPHPDVKVEVEQLTITPAQISFDAETDGYASSAKVEEQLQAHPKFDQATKGQETKLANGRVKFPITIPLGDVVGDADEEG